MWQRRSADCPPALALVPHGSCSVLCLLFLLFPHASTDPARITRIYPYNHPSFSFLLHSYPSSTKPCPAPLIIIDRIRIFLLPSSHRVRIPKQTLIQIHYSMARANRIFYFWSKSPSSFVFALVARNRFPSHPIRLLLSMCSPGLVFLTDKTAACSASLVFFLYPCLLFSSLRARCLAPPPARTTHLSCPAPRVSRGLLDHLEAHRTLLRRLCLLRLEASLRALIPGTWILLLCIVFLRSDSDSSSASVISPHPSPISQCQSCRAFHLEYIVLYYTKNCRSQFNRVTSDHRRRMVCCRCASCGLVTILLGRWSAPSRGRPSAHSLLVDYTGLRAGAYMQGGTFEAVLLFSMLFIRPSI